MSIRSVSYFCSVSFLCNLASLWSLGILWIFLHDWFLFPLFFFLFCREAQGRGWEDTPKVSRSHTCTFKIWLQFLFSFHCQCSPFLPLFHTGHLRKSRKVGHCDYRQEEIFGPVRPDGRPIRVRHPQAHQAVTWQGHLHLRQRSSAAYGWYVPRLLALSRAFFWSFSLLLYIYFIDSRIADQLPNPLLFFFPPFPLFFLSSYERHLRRTQGWGWVPVHHVSIVTQHWFGIGGCTQKILVVDYYIQCFWRNLL